MAATTDVILKSFFETGDIPTSSQYQDLIDSKLNLRSIKVFSVRDYGATGDGITDDSGAISAALAAAGTTGVVYFPPGTYQIGATKYSITGTTKLMGSGTLSTILSDGTGVVFTITSGSGTVVKDLEFDQDSTAFMVTRWDASGAWTTATVGNDLAEGYQITANDSDLWPAYSGSATFRLTGVKIVDSDNVIVSGITGRFGSVYLSNCNWSQVTQCCGGR